MFAWPKRYRQRQIAGWYVLIFIYDVVNREVAIYYQLIYYQLIARLTRSLLTRHR